MILHERTTTEIPPMGLYGRVISILDRLVDRANDDPCGVRELSDKLELSKSAVGRVLIELANQDLAAEFPGGKYGVGPKLQIICDHIQRSDPVMLVGQEIARELDADPEVSTCLALDEPGRDSFFYALATNPAPGLSFRPPIGRSISGSVEFGIRDATSGNFSDTVLENISTRMGLTGAFAFMATHEKLPDALLERIRTYTDRLARSNASRDLPRKAVTGLSRGSAAYRIHRVLSALASSAGLVNDDAGLVAFVDAKKQTVDQLLGAAAATGLVLRSERVIGTGPLLYRWAARMGKVDNLARVLRPRLHDLSKRTGETIGLVIYDEVERKCRFEDAVHGWHSLQYHLELGAEVPLYAGAAGKAILAYCDEEVVAAQEVRPYTANTLPSLEAVREDLRHVRDRGWATGDGERVEGAFGVAVPFFRDGRVAGSLTATIPMARKDQIDVRQLAGDIRETASHVSALISLA